MIYFIRAYNQFIKIGYTTDLSSRIKQLQTSNAFKLHVKAVLPGCQKTEKALHRMFAHLTTGAHNEWFKYGEDLKWFMRAIQENPEVHNILELERIALQMRIQRKTNRLGKKHKLSKRLDKYGHSRRSQGDLVIGKEANALPPLISSEVNGRSMQASSLG
jgi:hypothetical protein